MARVLTIYFEISKTVEIHQKQVDLLLIPIILEKLPNIIILQITP